jgi:uncharacterized protein
MEEVLNVQSRRIILIPGIKFIAIFSLCFIAICMSSCKRLGSDSKEIPSNQTATDSELAQYITRIKAVDNHAHPNTLEPNDTGSDALPLDVLGPIELPARLRPESPDWIVALKALYGYSGTTLNEKKIKDLLTIEDKFKKEKGEKFPEWTLDQTGIEVMLANRISMGPGISSPRFRWVSYVDALLFPLSTKAEASVTPDRKNLFPLEEHLLMKYLSDLKISRLPSSLPEYLKQVVTATLEAQKKDGCIALKFEAAYLRSLDFKKTELQPASEVYSKYVHGGEPSHEQYKLLQDFLFRYIAREAGRLGMVVHIHSLSAFGNYYVSAESDPILLESVLNDPELRNTKFVLLHGGGIFSSHTSAMLWKPNFYADISMLTRLCSPDQLAVTLRDWLSQFPEKVLFGTDACSFGPGLGWETGAWIASSSGRKALTVALSGMISSNEISLIRAKEIAIMVMRTNAGNLYQLDLK